MTTPSFDETHEYTITELSNQPTRIMLGIDQPFPPEWKPEAGRIWVVPQDALEWGYANQSHVHAGATMILPAEEQAWRDDQHYRAYVRPTKEEDA